MAATLALSSAVSAATCGSSSVCRPSAASSHGAQDVAAPVGLRLAPLPVGAAKCRSWSSKTVSNGSRVHAFNVVNPDTNIKFETLSYLPPLTDNQIFKQIDYLIRQKLIPAIEFDKHAELTRVNHNSPGYYDGRYWTLWKLPLFGVTDAGQVLREIQEAKKAYPEHYIRVIGFDNIKQVQSISFIAHRPSDSYV